MTHKMIFAAFPARAFTCFAIGLVAMTNVVVTSAAGTTQGPNVVIILTDDQGYGDVAIHDNETIRTPHLDRFARNGVRMTRFYCSPVCALTRACLMTGRYYYRTGVIHTSRGGAKMHGDEVTIAEMLAQAGYCTGIFGKWHLGDNYPMRPTDQGFAEALIHKGGGLGQTPDRPNSYFDSLLWHNNQPTQAKGYCTDVFTDGAIRFIESNRNRPFFVYLATNAPHTPLEIAEKYVAPYRARGLDETTAKVYGMVENIDQNVGRLLRTLDELALRDKTLVIFLTDNGPQQKRPTAGLRGRKSWVYEGGIRVPCFVQWPKQIKGERLVAQPSAHIDLFPTVLEACGVTMPAELQIDGVSVLPQLRGDKESFDRALFFQCHRGLQPQRYHNCAVVTQRYKLVGGPGTFGQEELLADEPAHLEIYDLLADPGETTDLAGQLPNMITRLQTAYDRWFDDVRGTRDFTPGVIQIGSAAENPTHLCRYQDGSYHEGFSQGWSVQVLRGGSYRVGLPSEEQAGPGKIFVSWNGSVQSKPAVNGAADFQLGVGQGNLDIWFQATGQPRVRIGDNSTLGDVRLTRVD